MTCSNISWCGPKRWIHGPQHHFVESWCPSRSVSGSCRRMARTSVRLRYSNWEKELPATALHSSFSFDDGFSPSMIPMGALVACTFAGPMDNILSCGSKDKRSILREVRAQEHDVIDEVDKLCLQQRCAREVRIPNHRCHRPLTPRVCSMAQCCTQSHQVCGTRVSRLQAYLSIVVQARFVPQLTRCSTHSVLSGFQLSSRK